MKAMRKKMASVVKNLRRPFSGIGTPSLFNVSRALLKEIVLKIPLLNNEPTLSGKFDIYEETMTPYL
jgi:hypothetical protein